MDSRWCLWRNKNEELKRVMFVLLLGQVVSFVMALMSFTSSLVANLGADTPLTLSFFSYLALVLVYGGILIYRRQKLLVRWYWYLLMGFVDVQGNYLAESSVIQNRTNAPESTQKRRPGRRGRKSAVATEVIADYDQELPKYFTWWRGGKLLLQLKLDILISLDI